MSEEAFVPIGGIEQWITIKGEDSRNPVILVLHGGPGDAWSPFADSMFAGWDKDFTLVQWDQRGAGRTYGRTGPAIEPTMTIDRMVQDGVEVAQYLRTHLGKKRIILVGGSWGSILGIHMAKRRPDLFCAYVGTAQVVNVRESHAAGYARLLALARAASDQEVVKALETIGPPPWDSLRKWPVFRKPLMKYQAKNVTARPQPMTIDPAYASPSEQAQYEEADDFSFIHFEGMTMSGPMQEVDLASLGTDFAIPVFVFQGQEDLVAPPELAKAYFDKLVAPRKKFVLVPGTGHEPSVPQLESVLMLLREDIKPECMEQ